MARKGYIKTLEDLKDWFMQAGDPRWSLYRGHIEKLLSTHTLGKQDDQETGMEDSWELQRRMIEMNSADGGDFTVYVKNNASNRGWSVYYRADGPAKQPGIGNLPAQYAQMGYVPETKVQEEIAREREKWELERRLEDMEGALEAKQSMGEAFIGQIIQTVDWNQILTPFARSIAAATGGKMNPEALKNAQVNISGHPEGEAAPDGDGEAFELSAERLSPALGALATHFETPDEFYQALENLARFAQANPAVIKQFNQHEQK